MKTLNTKKLAVALLVMAGAFTLAPAGQAETSEGKAAATYGPSTVAGHHVSVRFEYDPTADAQAIYTKLQSAARDACRYNGVKTIVMRRFEERCERTMVNSGVSQFGRADIAQLHQGRIAVANR
jgi:hypothetical protein